MHKAYVDLEFGQVHVVTAGAGPTVLLLHQTPRSWREYEAVIPLLASHGFRVVAMDTVGFGESDQPEGPGSIEVWATAAGQVLDALDAERAHVVGHHTGGVIAVELAAQRPELVQSLVLSSTPFTDAAFRAARAERPPIDEVDVTDDGTWLTALWGRRQGFYPEGRADLLTAFVRDALVVIDRLEYGHRAVGSYRMEDRIAHVGAPVLIVRATDDPFASPHAAGMAAALDARCAATIVDIPGGMVPLPDQLPAEFVAAIVPFIRSLP
jgi:pimeloyl-ACP methyl ester carboxylesterase